jgi:DNA replication protein DnaC
MITTTQNRLWAALAARPAGPPSTETSSPAVCPHCGGLGLLSLELPVGDPNFGKAFVCICQRDEHLARIQSRALADAAIPARFKDFSFDSFIEVCAGNLNDKRTAFDAAQLWAEGAAVKGKQGLAISGSFGGGKTGLAASALNKMARFGTPVAWLDAGQFFARVQAGYGAGTAQTTMDAAAGCPVLLLDDLGDVDRNSQETDDKRRILYAVMSARHAANAKTIITTNLDPDQFVHQWGRRISERVFELCYWVLVAGAHLRQF